MLILVVKYIYIYIPVQVVFCVAVMPAISISSLTLIVPIQVYGSASIVYKCKKEYAYVAS